MLESLQNNVFTYKKLTEAEMNSRNILGRLTGVIADTKAPTRNGRLYGADLWEHVFNDPVMQEKIENRCCFGEFGHPLDREEVDPEKIAICLAETPKVGEDGKLYGIFDILNTPCGKILKTLCDYGTNIGVSSRGSGDIMNNDEVDPDTYYCECWDAVLVPAVKAARQKYVTESLDTNTMNLRKALTESYEAASDEDKKVMKEKLDELNINLIEEASTEETVTTYDEVDEEGQLIDSLTEAKADEAEIETAEEEEVKDEQHEESEDAEEQEVDSKVTVGDLINNLEEFDKELPVEFNPIVIDGTEYQIDNLVFDNDAEDKIVVNVSYNSEMSDNIDDKVEIEATETEIEPIEKIVLEEPEDEEVQRADEEKEEAIDDGADEVLESLKEVLRQKEQLEQEVKDLKANKTVDDIKVGELKEELNKYKTSFMRISDVAANSKKLEASNKQLNESLSAKDVEIEKLKKSIISTKQTLSESLHNKLNESAKEANVKIIKLTEQLSEAKKELENKDNMINDQAAQYKKSINEKLAIAEAYKKKYTEVLNQYIKSKASMLNVRTSEITSRLTENFTFNDIDSVCEELLTEGLNFGSLPVNMIGRTKITQSKPQSGTKKINAEYGYDIDDDLLKLAGLK